MINDNMLNERLQVYLDKQIAVHLVKKNGEWLNGFVKEKSTDFIILEEFKKGLMPIFISEVSYIETFTKEGEGNGSSS